VIVENDLTYRRSDIQGLRGIAVLLVVFFHAGLLIPGGFIGVDVFFVVSGYVITSSLIRENTGSESIKLQLKNFYIRRAKRLIPALGALIFAVMIASYFVESSWGEQQRTALSGIASTFSFANIRYALDSSGYFSLAAKTNPLLHIWSLSVEEQFYIVFPILVIALLRKSRNFYQTKFVLWVIAFVSFVLSILLSYGLPPFESVVRAQQFAFYMPFARTWEFLAGVLIALPVSKRWAIFDRLEAVRLMQIIGMIGILFSSFFIQDLGVFPGFSVLIPVVSTVVLIRAGSKNPGGLISRWCSTSWLVLVGNISYSWYLWHWPFIVFAQRIWSNTPYVRELAAISSLLPALLSFQFIENPWRNQENRPKKNITSIFFLFVLLPLLAGALLFWQANRAQPNNIQVDQSTKSDIGVDCNYLEESCFDLNPDRDQQILLVGDSHAAALFPLVKFVGEQNAVGVNIVSRPGCPFLDRELAFYLYTFESQNLMTRTDCVKAYSEAIQWLSSSRVDLVLFANNAPLYVGEPRLDQSFDLRIACFTLGEGCDYSNDYSLRLQQYKDLLISSVYEILEYSDRVVLIAPLPYQFRDPSDFVRDGNGALGTPRSAVDGIRDNVLQVLNDVSSLDDRIAVWDPIETLCNDDVCPESIDGESNYSDNSHLSIAGTFLTARSLNAALQLK
jgi:peptidoglycan/LPS O-acetylase OafA/YrhL